MKHINDPLLSLEAFTLGKEAIKKRRLPLYLTGVVDAAKPHMMHALATKGQKLVVTFNELKAKELVEDLKFFEGDTVYMYPARDMIFYSADVHSNDLMRDRLDVIEQLLLGADVTVVLSVEALLDAIVDRSIFQANVLKLKVLDTVVVNDLSKQLTYMGYERVTQVEGKGQFAVRGGIWDIYPIHSDDIFRLELFGDEIDSMRLVNADTQRSMQTVESMTIMPVREMVVSDEGIKRAQKSLFKEYEALKNNYIENGLEEPIEHLEHTYKTITDKMAHNGNFNGIESLIHYYYDSDVIMSILDYFDRPIIYLDEPMRIEARLKSIQNEFHESIKNRYEKGYVLPGQMKVLHPESRIIKALGAGQTVLLSALQHQTTLVPHKESYDLLTKSVSALSTNHHNFELWIQDIKYYLDRQYQMLFLTGSKTRAKRLIESLEHYDIMAYLVDDYEQPLVPGQMAVAYGALHKGFEYPQIPLIVLTETEMMGKTEKKKKRRKFKEGRKIDHFSDLKVGDYVVHENYGVGVFSGIEQIEVSGVTKDFIKIAYKDSANLYVTTNQLDVIQKYIGAEGKAPKLHKLGGTEWKKAKYKVRQAVEALAEDLIDLYAKREVTEGFAFGQDTVWQQEFEELFPYEETSDQLQAIEETKKDMQSKRIMDRLICGDVGYGKTEVAIRAAFKAVQDDKQVAYLVPTTILAQQQYNNFRQRMKDFPVRVEMLSRFKTQKEQKMILEDLNRGLVDIVIGTHRLFSKDMHFKRLGLLIVDEEQRFGVKHKEALKQLKEDVDVLTLTATPIPRTLHMSLIGIRDMSVLEEPPQERHPVQTYVLEYNEELVKDAIYRELARDGQVYYVYNRVKGIDRITDHLRTMVPEANVAYAHGQMREHELENIMLDFVNGDIDVLVSTTIIETGLDIQNANTIVIHDADKMGLSQLYQLRGRVGRSNRIAYAYLMYKRDKVLDEVAEKRLQAIREFTEFGSGFKIAMRDLEIRGAGNILGTSQHGHMDAVGYDLYCKMLEEAVGTMTDQGKSTTVETSIDVDVDAYIPDSYIEDEVRKLESYKKIATIRHDEDYEDMLDELMDRYGDLPRSVMNLLDIALIKRMAMRVHVLEIKQKGYSYLLAMSPEAPMDHTHLKALFQKYQGHLKFTVSDKPYFTFTLQPEDKRKGLSILKVLMVDMQPAT